MSRDSRYWAAADEITRSTLRDLPQCRRGSRRPPRTTDRDYPERSMDRNLVLLNRNIARLRRDVRLQSSEIASRTSKTLPARSAPMPWSGNSTAQLHTSSAQDQARVQRLVFRSSCCPSPTSAAIPSKTISSMV
jgi:hypothetical protein